MCLSTSLPTLWNRGAASSSPSKSVHPMLAESCSGAGLNPTCCHLLRVVPHLSPPFQSIHCHYILKGKAPQKNNLKKKENASIVVASISSADVCLTPCKVIQLLHQRDRRQKEMPCFQKKKVGSTSNYGPVIRW